MSAPSNCLTGKKCNDMFMTIYGFLSKRNNFPFLLLQLVSRTGPLGRGPSVKESFFSAPDMEDSASGMEGTCCSIIISFSTHGTTRDIYF